MNIIKSFRLIKDEDKVKTGTGITNVYKIAKIKNQLKQGHIQGGGAIARPIPKRFFGGRPPPWIFRILRERALSLTTAIEKETKRKKEKEEIYKRFDLLLVD